MSLAPLPPDVDQAAVDPAVALEPAMVAAAARPRGRRRTRRVALTVSSTLAIGVPVAISSHVHDRIQTDLAGKLTRLTGQACEIDGVDAGLTGSVRLTNVKVGDMFSADAIEGSVSLGSLLAGQIGADEIRVERPLLRAHMTADGELDVTNLFRRVAAARATPGSRAASRRLRRVIVTQGELRVEIAGVGDVAADGVELHPEPGGVRVITGNVRATGVHSGLHIDGGFARVAADVQLATGTITRVLAVRGHATLRHDGDDAALHVDQLSLARGLDGDPQLVWLRGDADDAGVPRPLTLAVAPGRAPSAWLTTTGMPLAPLAGFLPSSLETGSARFHGMVGVATGPDGIAINASGEVEALRWRDRDVAAEPLPLDLGGHLEARLHGAQLDILASQLDVGAARLHVTGTLTTAARRLQQADLTFVLDRAPCLGLLDSLPAPLRSSLDGLTLGGELAARAHIDVALDKPVGDGVRLQLDLPSTACTVVADAPGADPTSLGKAQQHTFVDGSSADIGPGTRGWTDLAGLPPHVTGAFVVAEDDGFWTHHGFDLTQIARSLEVNLRTGQLARGGSTISQQLMKNLFLSHRRSFDRKLQEAILTWRLEATTSKATILAYYLNIVELGPSVYGLAEAAAYWFDREPRRLTPRQAAFLAAMTPEPGSWRRRIAAAGTIDPQSLARVDQVLRQMRRAGVIDKATYDIAITAPLTLQARALTNDAAVATARR